MAGKDDEFVILEDGPQAGDAVENELTKSLRENLPQSQNVNFVLSARDHRNRLAGGLTAATSYGWLLVKTLWVAEKHRRQGLGRSLMKSAEDKARGFGCHSVWLDTSNPDAMNFYRKLGYEVFGQLSNSASQPPAGHRRWFMKKPL